MLVPVFHSGVKTFFSHAFQRLLWVLLVGASLSHAFPARAQELHIPNFWDQRERFIRPDVKDLQRLRFLTVTEFPPFSFIDGAQRLSGFHIDLARAICAELELINVCQIQALPFDELEPALRRGNGEAILAGISQTRQNRQVYDFSRPYFRLPARFATRVGGPRPPSGTGRDDLLPQLAGQSVAVISGTAHAAFAQTHFGNVRLRLFANRQSAFQALVNGQVVALFDDALGLSFLLQEEPGLSCCHFSGGPYLSVDYFGAGLAIAVAKDNRRLAQALNFALRSINDKGIFAELYLRYFPVSLF